MEDRSTINIQKAYAKINLALDVTGIRPNGYHDVNMVMQSISLHDIVEVELVDQGSLSDRYSDKLEDNRKQLNLDGPDGSLQKAVNKEECDSESEKIRNSEENRGRFHIELNTNLTYLPSDSRNIAYRAAELMLEKYVSRTKQKCEDSLCSDESSTKKCSNQTSCLPGVRIRIEKNIPVAAGMAGGSTDAAAVIRALNELLGLNLTQQEMMETGLTLGADVPYCICGGTMQSRGIGEVLDPLPSMPKCYILTVKPGYGVSTRDVYRGIDEILFKNSQTADCCKPGSEEPDTQDADCCKPGSEKSDTQTADCCKPGSVEMDNQTSASQGMGDNLHADVDGVIAGLKEGSLDKITASMSNVLELYTIDAHPDIALIKEIMVDNGAVGALMSGSGPTVFGIFRHKNPAILCEEIIRSRGLCEAAHISEPCVS